jgi:hypothetical protein
MPGAIWLGMYKAAHPQLESGLSLGILMGPKASKTAMGPFSGCTRPPRFPGCSARSAAHAARPLQAARRASLARVKFSISESESSESRSLYIPGYFASGTISFGKGFECRFSVTSATGEVFGAGALGRWACHAKDRLQRHPRALWGCLYRLSSGTVSLRSLPAARAAIFTGRTAGSDWRAAGRANGYGNFHGKCPRLGQRRILSPLVIP